MIYNRPVTNIEFWANVALVTFEGIGTRFVSYKELPQKVLEFYAYYRYTEFDFEKNMMIQNAIEAYNEFLRMRALAAVEDWTFVEEDGGYLIAGVYVTVYHTDLHSFICQQLGIAPF
ncbi:hypothetical protein [Myxosarcina sp. GI1(2024)]